MSNPEAECLMADCKEPSAHFCVTHVLDVHSVAVQIVKSVQNEWGDPTVSDACDDILVRLAAALKEGS